jgi:hypothetical protein
MFVLLAVVLRRRSGASNRTRGEHEVRHRNALA